MNRQVFPGSGPGHRTGDQAANSGDRRRVSESLTGRDPMPETKKIRKPADRPQLLGGKKVHGRQGESVYPAGIDGHQARRARAIAAHPITRPPVARVMRAYCAGKITIRGIGLALGITPAEAKAILDLYDIEEKPHGRREKKDSEDGHD